MTPWAAARRTPLALLAVVFAVAACSTGGGGPGGAAAVGDEAWRTIPIRDVVSGEEFRIADLEGNVVAIETMAIWCVSCRFQQLEAQAALADVDSPDVVYLSLDVDPNERADDLAEYARREGFDWRFAVASPDVARSLAASFGDQVLSPPATPIVVLGPDGQVVEQHVGIMGAGDLAALFEEHMP
jgi:hypothetical protein